MTDDLPYLHGPVHRPGGSDPVLPGVWIYAAAAATAWASGTAYSAGDIISHDQFNYRALVDSSGIEPNVSSGWPSYWAIYQMVFQNGWTNIGGTSVPMRVGITLGQMNALDRSTGAITEYRPKRLDIEGDIKGGADDTTVCWVPPAYRHDYDIPLHAHDDDKLYVAGRIYSAGNIVMATA